MILAQFNFQIIYLWLFHGIDLKLCYKRREPDDDDDDDDGNTDGGVDGEEFVHGDVDNNKKRDMIDENKIKPLLLLIQVLLFILRFYHLILDDDHLGQDL